MNEPHRSQAASKSGFPGVARPRRDGPAGRLYGAPRSSETFTKKARIFGLVAESIPRGIRAAYTSILVSLCFIACWIGVRPRTCRADNQLLRVEKIIAAEDDAEFSVQIQAVAPATSWDDTGRECALVKILLDGRYDQHIFLFGGAKLTAYDFLVGPLPVGEHRLEFHRDNSWTPDLQESPDIRSMKAVPLDRRDPAQEPSLRAPILHLRKDTVGRFSDVPLILYWDLENASPGPARHTYTVIFSNEDGGTETERLMARWGRTTDIEWCYSYARNGYTLVEELQGRNHEALPFRGQKEGWHPVLYDVTTNNNFADSIADPPPCRVRPLPVHANLQGRARESVMDRFPWTYAVMAQEMLREGKIEIPGDPATAKLSDLRNYAYFEVCTEQSGTEMYFEVQLKPDGRWFRSDHGDPKSGIGRGGCARSTAELPPGSKAQDIRALRINCRPAPLAEGEMPVRSPGAVVRAVSRLFLLDENYHPGPNLLDRSPNRKLKPGQSLTLTLDDAQRR